MLNFGIITGKITRNRHRNSTRHGKPRTYGKVLDKTNYSQETLKQSISQSGNKHRPILNAWILFWSLS